MKNLLDSIKLLDKSTLFYLTATNTGGEYLYVNEKFAATFSHASTDFIGQSSYTSMHPNDIKKVLTIQARCLANPDQVFATIIRKLNTAGTYIYTQWECRALNENDDENPSGIYGIGYNITKYVAKQRQLKDAQQENQEKRAIIEEVVFQQSHLIRAPLTNIMGLTNVFLEEQLLKIDSSSTCAMIVESTKQLDDIIKNIVKISRN
jgi:PAS domain S-box-containing protein